MSRINELISVIVPAYNEEKIIAENLKTISQELSEFCDEFEIILSDDGSVDNTRSEAEKLTDSLSNLIVTGHSPNAGKGQAVKTGFKSSKGKLVAFLDADLDLAPSLLKNLHQIMDSEKADVVIGSKQHPDSNIHYPFLRKIMSKVYYGMVKFLFGLKVRDTQTGIKIFKREVLEKVFEKAMVEGFAFDVELLALANKMGYKICEGPVILTTKRESGRIGIKDILAIWKDTINIWLRIQK